MRSCMLLSLYRDLAKSYGYNESRPHSRLDYLPPVEWRNRQAELSALLSRNRGVTSSLR